MNNECENMLNAIEMKMIIECMITCNVETNDKRNASPINLGWVSGLSSAGSRPGKWTSMEKRIIGGYYLDR